MGQFGEFDQLPRVGHATFKQEPDMIGCPMGSVLLQCTT